MVPIDEAWVLAHPEEAADLIDRLTWERDRADARAAAAEKDSAMLRASIARASCAGRRPVPTLTRIEAHLRATGTSHSAFGVGALGDPCLVSDLRNGRTLRPKTESRVLAYLDRLELAGTNAKTPPTRPQGEAPAASAMI